MDMVGIILTTNYLITIYFIYLELQMYAII